MIHVIRDPRDTVASIWDAAQRYGDPWGVIYDRIERAVDKWNAATRTSAAMWGRPRQFFVSYADFTRDPAACLDLIGAATGLPLRPAAPAPTRIATPSEPWKAQAVAGPVGPAPSKWQTALSAGERAVVVRNLCPEALAFLDRVPQLCPPQDQRHVA
jgi:hypothetical protein